MARRERAKWQTIKSVKGYEFQMNQYEERRILLNKRIFSTFHGYNAPSDAARLWKTIELFNK